MQYLDTLQSSTANERLFSSTLVNMHLAAHCLYMRIWQNLEWCTIINLASLAHARHLAIIATPYLCIKGACFVP